MARFFRSRVPRFSARVTGAGSSSSAGDAFFALRHHNYNVVALADTSGTVVERYDDNPYGERIVLEATTSSYTLDGDGVSDYANVIGHQGLYHDTATSLVHNRARALNPDLGRFMQRDPLGYVDGMSVYEYVRSTPVNWVDPFGLYGSAGHFYTPYILGRAAGWSRADAFEFAYWSQYPDEDPRYSAMGSRTAGLPLGMSEDINRALHQLNDSPAGPQRDLLECLLDQFEEPWQRGLLNHAFGDAFSHTEPGTGETYDTLFGHGFDGHQPDYIGNRPELYRQYARRLGDVLGVPEGSPAFNHLGDTARSAPTFDHAAEAIDFWAQARVRYGYGRNWWQPEIEGLEEVDTPAGANVGRLSRDQVRQFLDQLRNITQEDCCEE